jgi:hypothetical protein
LQNDVNQILGIAAVHIEGADHDFVGMDAEGGHAAAMEDAFDVEIELLLFGEVFCAFELESLVDTRPSVFLFGRMGLDLRTGDWGLGLRRPY